MYGQVLTVVWHVLAAWTLCRRAPESVRLFAIGTLPAVWITACSLAGFLQTATGINAAWTLGIVAIISFAACAQRGSADEPKTQDSVGTRLWALPTLWCAAAACVVLIYGRLVEPWGGWDAMFTWVLRGRFFFEGGTHWSNTFSNDLALLHPDYPPMLGWAISALWTLDGRSGSQAVGCLMLPVAVGYALTLAGLFRAERRHPARACGAIAAALSLPILWRLGAGSIADFLLSYAILTSAFWYLAGVRTTSEWKLFVAAALAGWCGLVKNEGVLWLVSFGATTVLAAIATRASKRTMVSLMLGLAIPAALVLTFKLTLAPPNDLSDPARVFQVGEIIQPGILVDPRTLILRTDGLLDPTRHRMIVDHLSTAFWNWKDWGLALPLLAILSVSRRSWQPGAPILLAISLQVLGYYAVYLTTPYHLYWHLSTSLSRILTHIVPTALMLCAMKKTTSPVASAATSQSPRVNRLISALATAYLVTMATWNAVACMSGEWRLGEVPPPSLERIAAIELPPAESASFVSDRLGNRVLFSMQFAVVPTVLVVDRREPILIADFRSEQALRNYCRKEGWDLQANIYGLGWARDIGGDRLRQPVTVDRVH